MINYNGKQIKRVKYNNVFLDKVLYNGKTVFGDSNFLNVTTTYDSNEGYMKVQSAKQDIIVNPKRYMLTLMGIWWNDYDGSYRHNKMYFNSAEFDISWSQDAINNKLRSLKIPTSDSYCLILSSLDTKVESQRNYYSWYQYDNGYNGTEGLGLQTSCSLRNFIPYKSDGSIYYINNYIYSYVVRSGSYQEFDYREWHFIPFPIFLWLHEDHYKTIYYTDWGWKNNIIEDGTYRYYNSTPLESGNKSGSYNFLNGRTLNFIDAKVFFRSSSNNFKLDLYSEVNKEINSYLSCGSLSRRNDIYISNC